MTRTPPDCDDCGEAEAWAGRTMCRSCFGWHVLTALGAVTSADDDLAIMMRALERADAAHTTTAAAAMAAAKCLSRETSTTARNAIEPALVVAEVLHSRGDALGIPGELGRLFRDAEWKAPEGPTGWRHLATMLDGLDSDMLTTYAALQRTLDTGSPPRVYLSADQLADEAESLVELGLGWRDPVSGTFRTFQHAEASRWADDDDWALAVQAKLNEALTGPATVDDVTSWADFFCAVDAAPATPRLVYAALSDFMQSQGADPDAYADRYGVHEALSRAGVSGGGMAAVRDLVKRKLLQRAPGMDAWRPVHRSEGAFWEADPVRRMDATALLDEALADGDIVHKALAARLGDGPADKIAEVLADADDCGKCREESAAEPEKPGDPGDDDAFDKAPKSWRELASRLRELGAIDLQAYADVQRVIDGASIPGLCLNAPGEVIEAPFGGEWPHGADTLLVALESLSDTGLLVRFGGRRWTTVVRLCGHLWPDTDTTHHGDVEEIVESEATDS